jgi:HK97 family phage major capsid protein
MTIQELLQKKGELAHQAEQILAEARNDNRLDLRAEEEQKFDAIHADIEKLTGTIARIEKQEALGKTEGRKSDAVAPAGSSRVAPVVQPSVTRAVTAWAKAGAGLELTNEDREVASRMGLNLASNQFTIHLPRNPLRNLSPEGIRDWEERAQSLAATEGGNTVADEMIRAIEKARLYFGGMFQAAHVVRTETGADLPWPTANDTSQKGARLGINTQVATQDVVYGQMVLKAFKYSSKLVLIPIELIQDAAINIGQFTGELLGERIARIVNEETTTGAGTTLPWGIVTRATAFNGGVGSATSYGNTALGVNSTGVYQNLINFEHSVDIEYRRGASFMLHDLSLASLKQLVDGQQRPLWTPGLTVGAPDRFLGYPYIINNDMVSTKANNARTLLFGQLSNYKLREVMGIDLIRLNERYADFHQVGFLAVARYDGDLLNAGVAPVKAFVHQT